MIVKKNPKRSSGLKMSIDLGEIIMELLDEKYPCPAGFIHPKKAAFLREEALCTGDCEHCFLRDNQRGAA